MPADPCHEPAVERQLVVILLTVVGHRSRDGDISGRAIHAAERVARHRMRRRLECRQHELVVKRSRKGGRVFYGCNGYPACDFTLWERPLPTPCPVCGGLMVEAGKRGSGAKCTACSNTSRAAAPERALVTAD